MRELTLKIEGSDSGIQRLLDVLATQEDPIVLARVQGVEYADSAHQIRVLDVSEDR